MTLKEFIQACNWTSLSEAEKACHLGFFYLKTKVFKSLLQRTARSGSLMLAAQVQTNHGWMEDFERAVALSEHNADGD